MPVVGFLNGRSRSIGQASKVPFRYQEDSLLDQSPKVHSRCSSPIESLATSSRVPHDIVILSSPFEEF
jgi:hypothetical protein